jgi:3-hydroxyacyl-CoA dehydrogenase
MPQDINTVAVIGGGTMGSGIAALAALSGCDVTLLEVNAALAERAAARVAALGADDSERQTITARVRCRVFAEALADLKAADWICEAALEDLAVKHDILSRASQHARADAFLSTNTSGIPLAAIAAGLPSGRAGDLAVTHFFNPVRVMRLLEYIPGPAMPAPRREALGGFLRQRLGKGVVAAKDTPNFIGNRIGCFFILAGLGHGAAHRAAGLDVAAIDAVLGQPIGLPATALYGLADLIGLDVMAAIGANLDATLPGSDAGRAFTHLPVAEQAMLARGQLGRKSGGGYYRIVKAADGSKTKQQFAPEAEVWAPIATAARETRPLADLFFAEDGAGRVVRDVLGATLAYAADLVPAIADDIVNVDRALRWGFNWTRGPFEMIDAIGPAAFAAWCTGDGRRAPYMLDVLARTGGGRFYGAAGFLAADGSRRPLPPE